MKKIALIGSPVKHSFSPAMHNKAFRSSGLPYVYETMDVPSDEFEKRWNSLSPSDYMGFNVTIPHKENVWRSVKELSDDARYAEAVNTVLWCHDHWKGYNTDISGWLKPLFNFSKQRKGWKLDKALIVGAGGAAKAVAIALASRTDVKHISLLSRTLSRCQNIQQIISKHFSSVVCTVDQKKEETIASADLVVNATPLGMLGEKFDYFPDDWIQKGTLCYDLIYTSEQTPFLKKASARGAFILNGLEMLLWQGVYAWEIWTGQKAPVEIMRDALKESLRQKHENRSSVS